MTSYEWDEWDEWKGMNGENRQLVINWPNEIDSWPNDLKYLSKYTDNILENI